MTSGPGVIGGEGSLAAAAPGGAGGGDSTANADEDDYDYNHEDDADDEEEEEEVVMDEEEMLQMLDQMEPPLSVCQRLFKEEDEGAEGKEEGDGSSWLVLSASQRSSLRQRGFVVLDALAPAGLATEAYEEATARAAAGSLAPAHGGGGTTNATSAAAMPPPDGTDGDRGPDDDGGQAAGGQHASTAAPAAPPQLTGYVRSVRDDLTAFVSAEREEATACAEKGAGAVSRILAILAGLGEDLGRMVRLKGRVEHQLAVYPAGIGARYERHRDAYPDDGYDDDEEEEQEEQEEGENSGAARAEGSEGKDGCGSGSVSFRRVTAICYLRGSESPWQARDGGALRLYPPAASNADQDVSSSDGRVVFKFASQLGISDESDLKEQPQELQQQQPAPNSGDGGGGGGDKDEDNEGSNSLPTASCGGSGDGGDGAGDARGSVDGIGNGGDGDGQRQDFVDVAPLAGRAVVFLSGAVEHEVLPVTGTLPRAALTTWFH